MFSILLYHLNNEQNKPTTSRLRKPGQGARVITLTPIIYIKIPQLPVEIEQKLKLSLGKQSEERIPKRWRVQRFQKAKIKKSGQKHPKNITDDVS